jgi:hypothetical protein
MVPDGAYGKMFVLIRYFKIVSFFQFIDVGGVILCNVLMCFVFSVFQGFILYIFLLCFTCAQFHCANIF